MTYLVTGLALVAAVFYGLWQHGKAKSEKDHASRLSDALGLEALNRAGDAFRHEVEVGTYKQRLADARRILDATRSDDALRAELGVLLTSPAAPASAARMPHEPASEPESAGVPAVPAGPDGVSGPDGSGDSA